MRETRSILRLSQTSRLINDNESLACSGVMDISLTEVDNTTRRLLFLMSVIVSSTAKSFARGTKTCSTKNLLKKLWTSQYSGLVN